MGCTELQGLYYTIHILHGTTGMAGIISKPNSLAATITVLRPGLLLTHAACFPLRAQHLTYARRLGNPQLVKYRQESNTHIVPQGDAQQ